MLSQMARMALRDPASSFDLEMLHRPADKPPDPAPGRDFLIGLSVGQGAQPTGVGPGTIRGRTVPQGPALRVPLLASLAAARHGLPDSGRALDRHANRHPLERPGPGR